MPSPLRLRSLTPEERAHLEMKVQTKTLPVHLHQRYRIVLESSRGLPVAAIAERVGCARSTARRWVRRCNESGFTTFARIHNPHGRPALVSGEQVRGLIKVALSRPEDLGLPCTHWSIAKLKAYCFKQGLLPPITDEWVRRLLRREGVSFQHTKTWKESPDPEFEVKKTASSTSMLRRRKVVR
jgi:transposase